MKPDKSAKSRGNFPPTGDSVKVGDLVVPSAFSKYKEFYPPKLVIAIKEREGKSTLVLLEGEEVSRPARDLVVVSS